MATANFPDELLTTISSDFGALAGIPLLMPFAGFFLGLGTLVPIVERLGDALVNRVQFSVTDLVNFEVPGARPAVADFRVLTGPELDATRLSYDDDRGLLYNGVPYQGDYPYIVISLDGKQRDELKAFAPTAASAEILQRFFRINKDGKVQGTGGEAVEAVTKGFQLASDLRYREDAIKYQKELDAMKAADPARADVQKKLDAAIKNISEDALKPK